MTTSNSNMGFTLALTIVLILFTGCSSVKKDLEPTLPKETEMSLAQTNAQTQINELQGRVQDLETRISALNEKISISLQPDSKSYVHPDTHVINKPAAASAPVKSSHKSDFGNSEAVDRYREAKILFDSNKAADSIIEFASFVKNFPTHPYAPAAQYFMGQAYFVQKEYKMAEEEWARGLVNYPHSAYIPDTLASLAEVNQALGKTDKSDNYRQKLTQLFSNSPQAMRSALAVQSPVKSRPATADEMVIPEPKVDTIPVIDAPKESAYE